LDYFVARYYSAAQGRFTSPDPLLTSGRIENPQTWNRYNYVLANPLKFSDPLGLFEYDASVSQSDRNRIDKAYEAAEKARDKYKPGTKQYNAINKALTALGQPGVKNGVTVSVDNALKTPGETYSNLEYKNPATTGGGSVNGSSSTVTLNLSKFTNDDAGKAQLAGALAHEGTHVSDGQSEATRLNGMTFVQVDQLYNSGGIMSKAITEVNAYRVSAYVAAKASPSGINSTGFNGSEIWNRGWKAAVAEQNRENGIRGVLESPQGTYQYKFSGTSTLNNALDNAKLWTVDGGPLLK
jgi:hypothetical protein